MPVRIRKVPGKKCFRVSTPGGVKAKCTTRAKAEAQKRIIERHEGKKPHGSGEFTDAEIRQGFRRIS